MKVLRIAVALAVILAVSVAAHAQKAQNFAVLPFKINGPAKYQYLSKAIQSMLVSRLTWKDHFMPVDASGYKDKTLPNPADTAGIVKTIDSMGSDYLIWGSSTFVEDNVTVDVNVSGKDGKYWPKHASMPVKELIPGLEKIARSITGEIFKKPMKKEKEKTRSDNMPTAPNNPEIMFADTGKPTSSVEPDPLNPRFRYQTTTSEQNRVRGQALKIRSKGFLVEDLDSDGKNEVVILATGYLGVYRFKDKMLDKIAELDLPLRWEPVRMSAYDLERDGNKELILSGFMGKGPHAIVVKYSGSELTIFKRGINKYLNVVKMPPNYRPILIGQAKGHTKVFKAYGLREVDYVNGEFELTRKIAAPEFTNVFNFCYLPMGNDKFGVVQISSTDYVKLYSQGGEALSATDQTYNKSAIALPQEMMPRGMGPQNHDSKMDQWYYVPIRVSAFSLGSDGKYEILVAKDISTAGQVMENYRAYSQGEIHSLFWDGVGLNLYWKTRRIKGTITDYTVADLNNDGQLDLCVCVNTYPGALGVSNIKTVVVGYPLGIEDRK